MDVSLGTPGALHSRTRSQGVHMSRREFSIETALAISVALLALIFNQAFASAAKDRVPAAPVDCDEAQPARPVPNVLGLEGEAALVELDSADLSGEFENENFPGSVVVRQNPTSSTPANPCSTVTLLMRPVAPTETVIVPDVKDLRFVEAKALIALHGKLELVGEGADDDVVIDQEPKAGASVKVGSRVVVKLKPASSNPVETTVPELRRLTRGQAELKANDAGLTLVGDGADGDIVIRQTPQPGERARKGEVVSVVLQPPIPTPTLVSSSTPPTAPTSVSSSTPPTTQTPVSSSTPPVVPTTSSSISPTTLTTSSTSSAAFSGGSEPRGWLLGVVSTGGIAMLVAAAWLFTKYMRPVVPQPPPRTTIRSVRGNSQVHTERFHGEGTDQVFALKTHRKTGTSMLEEDL